MVEWFRGPALGSDESRRECSNPKCCCVISESLSGLESEAPTPKESSPLSWLLTEYERHRLYIIIIISLHVFSSFTSPPAPYATTILFFGSLFTSIILLCSTAIPFALVFRFPLPQPHTLSTPHLASLIYLTSLPSHSPPVYFLPFPSYFANLTSIPH